MPFASIRLRPGIQAEATQLLNESGYSSSNFGRFRAGLFEKIGGWAKFFSVNFTGIPRVLWAWQDFNNTKRLAIGTTTNVAIIANGMPQSIVPQTLTSNGAIAGNNSPTPGQINFSTTNTSPVVTIADGNIATTTTLDVIEFNTPVTVGGIVLSGVYAVTANQGANLYTITAATNATSTVTNGGALPTFTTVNGSIVVTVNITAHGLSANNKVVFPASTSGNGVTIQGLYTVNSIVDANNFTIAASNQATASSAITMNGSQVQIIYSIAIGPPQQSGTGWGQNGWGSPPWGGTGTQPSATTGSSLSATDWTMQNWGDTLLACPANGGVYQWGPTTGNINLAQIPAAPAHNSGILVAVPSQILFAFGASVKQNIGINQDPLTYAWSDQLDYTYWTGGTTNPKTGLASQAGSNRIPTGSAIIAGLAVPQQVLLWTDLDLWSVNYIGNTSQNLIFGQSKIGANCGTISRHGVAQLAGIVYWWGRNNFYALTGNGPQVMPCSVWDKVFQNLDPNNLDKVWVETVTSFNEVWFFYPSLSGGTGQCDSYAKVNVLDGSWDFGLLARSAGIDQSVIGNPVMASPSNGIIYVHETGYDNDGIAMTPTFTTGYFLIGDGEDFAFVDQFIPDFKYQIVSATTNVATVQITFSVINFPSDTPRVFGPYNMTTTTDSLPIRFRGRQMAITMSGADVGTWWRIGRPRYRWAPDGRR